MLDSLALSALDWWQEAGVDFLVDESPRDWLAPVAAPSAPALAQVTARQVVAAAAKPPLPATLAQFRAWLLTDATLPGPAAARIDAAGDAASGTMIVVDMPEQSDREAKRLLSGEAGALFDNMLPPMGLSRDTIYLASLAPARPASGRLDAAAGAALAPLLRHHIALAAPKRLLLFGDAAARALLGLSCIEARGRTHTVAIGDASVPTVATFHPRFLVQTPARKGAAWADLQLFMAL